MNNQNDDSIKEIKETGASLTDGKENKKRKADCVYVSTQHEEATNLAKAVNIPSEEDVMMVLEMENNHFLKMFEALKDYKRIHGKFDKFLIYSTRRLSVNLLNDKL